RAVYAEAHHSADFPRPRELHPALKVRSVVILPGLLIEKDELGAPHGVTGGGGLDSWDVHPGRLRPCGNRCQLLYGRKLQALVSSRYPDVAGPRKIISHGCRHCVTVLSSLRFRMRLSRRARRRVESIDN